MNARQIEFKFKGERNYIHGTDLFSALIGAAGGGVLSNIRFTLHGFVHTSTCTLYLSRKKMDLAEVDDVKSRCQLERDGEMCWMALVEGGGDSSSGGRYAYEESRIVDACRMDGDGIALTQPVAFDFIEAVVGMSKHMHQQLFPHAVGRWIFTRIDLDEICDAREQLSLRLIHNMNCRLTKSVIVHAGKPVGALYFSLVQT